MEAMSESLGHDKSDQLALTKGSKTKLRVVVANAVFFILLTLHPAEAKKGHNKKAMPHFAHAHLDNHTARVGSEVHFSCTVSNLGTYSVAWLHSEKGTLAVYPAIITQNDRITVSYDNRATYQLRLQSVKETDAGKYICQINTGPAISISGQLAVVVPPDIVDSQSSSDTLATEGMRVLLNCHARGNPQPTISWRREDEKNIRLCNKSNSNFNKNMRECRETRIHYGNELELTQVSRFDSGVYLCLASNGVPPTVSKRVKLYVDFPPTLWISHQLVGAQLGSTAELECLTAAHPPSLNYWRKDGQEKDTYISPKEDKYIMNRKIGKPSFYNILMKLQILNLTQEDFGTYRCLAKNSQGETDGEINLYEIPNPSTTAPYPYFGDTIWNTNFEEEPEKKKANETELILFNGIPDESDRYPEKQFRNKPKKNGRRRHHKKKRLEQHHQRADLQYGSNNSSPKYSPGIFKMQVSLALLTVTKELLVM